jgi:hypothetical protein
MKNPRIYKDKIYKPDEVIRIVETLNSSVNPPLPNQTRKLTCRGNDNRLHSVEIVFNEFNKRFSYRSEVLNGEVRIPHYGGMIVYRNHKKVAKVVPYKDGNKEVIYAMEIYVKESTRYIAFYTAGNKFAEKRVEDSRFWSKRPCNFSGHPLYCIAMSFLDKSLRND